MLQFEYKLMGAIVCSTLPWLVMSWAKTDTAEKEIMDRWGIKGH